MPENDHFRVADDPGMDGDKCVQDLAKIVPANVLENQAPYCLNYSGIL